MKKLAIFYIVLVFLVLATTAGAAVFNVSPTSDNNCSDYDCDLQSALNAAAANGQNDTINLSTGTYHFPTAIMYKPTAASGENYSLTITGTGENQTIISGGVNSLILDIDTTLLNDGSQASISLSGLSITGSGAVELKSNASVTVPKIDVGSAVIYGSDIQLTSTIAATGSITLNTAASALSGTGAINANGNITICTSNTCDASAEIPPGSTVSIESDFIAVIPPPISIGMTLWATRVNMSTEAGNTIILDASSSIPGNATGVRWTQMSGPPVIISAPESPKPSFVVPPISSGVTTFEFEYKALDSFGNTIIVPLTVTASSNGITNFPTADLTFKTVTNDNMGMTVSNGTVTSLVALNPASLTNNTGKPESLLYGALDLKVKVSNPGDSATVTVLLPAPAPAGYKWFKYNALRGWYDYSEHTSFNADRTQITLTLVDGGIGDDDGVANGVIVDPSALAADPSTSATGSKGSGCFIATAAYGSILHPQVATLREFRDKLLLTNSFGRAFVTLYYKYSPPIADFIARHDILRFFVRVCLLPAILFSWLALQLGSSALALIIMLSTAALVVRFAYKGIKRKSVHCGSHQLNCQD